LELRKRQRIDLSEVPSLQEARNLCLKLLAQRERSRTELLSKLAASGVDESVARHVVEELAAEALQSDERYAEVYVRSSHGKGRGPQRLRHELRARGIGGEQMESLLAEQDWDQALAAVHAKKFGLAKPKSPKEYSARVRFLMQRGFALGAIQSLLRRLGSEDEFPNTEDD
jgi:regulatory protein